MSTATSSPRLRRSTVLTPTEAAEFTAASSPVSRSRGRSSGQYRRPARGPRGAACRTAQPRATARWWPAGAGWRTGPSAGRRRVAVHCCDHKCGRTSAATTSIASVVPEKVRRPWDRRLATRWSSPASA
jgi:hypothetical protein